VKVILINNMKKINYKNIIKYKKQTIIVIYLNGQIYLTYSQPFYSLFHNYFNKTKYDFFFDV
jgi:hypothetical protein